MRELIRSILRFSWGTSLFWVRQAANGLAPSRASGDLRAVADAASGELSGALGGLYQQGAALQSRMIDAVVPTNGPASAGTSPPAASSPVPAQAPERRRNVDTGRLNTGSLVVLGEGLAAGMGDFSLSSDTQEQSFPAQMARQMGVDFRQPLFQPPGIADVPGFGSWTVVVPSPLQSTVLDRIPPDPPANLSVPGLTVAEAVRMRPRQPLIERTCGKQTALNLILGIRGIAYGSSGPLPTQLECAIERQPTIAVVALGYSEVLEVAVAGDPACLPDIASFCDDYSKIVRELRSAGAEVVLLTVPDPTKTAHFSSVETAAAIVKLDSALLLEFWKIAPDDLITANGLNEIGFQIYSASVGSLSADKSEGAAIGPLPAGSTLPAQVASAIRECVRSLNAKIAEIAAAERALVFDLHGFFERVHDSGVVAGTRVLTGDYLGGFYSLNGYYPGATGNALVANEILGLLNREFGASFEPVDVAAVMAADPVAAYKKAAGPNWRRENLLSASPLPLPPPPQTGTGQPAPTDPGPLPGGADYVLQLPPGLEQVLPLNPTTSYFGDAISAQNCRTPKDIQWGSGNNLIFGGLAMMDSHLRGKVRIRFTPPVDDWTTFQLSFEGGLFGTNSVIAAPRFFKMPGKQQLIGDVPGQVSSGRLNLRTGEVDLTAGALNIYAGLFNSALFALLSVNPNFPKVPLSFPGQYGSASVEFTQRSDGNLDFTFYGSTFVPLGNGTSFPLNFCGPSRQFASIPANGTAIHPHVALTTKETAPVAETARPVQIPINSVQEFSLFTPVTSFGDVFALHAPQLGGPATGRSRLLGRVQIQFGWPTENSVPIAVAMTTAGGVLAPLSSTPLSELFPGTLTPGPEGFDATLRFPFRSYSLNDLAVIDDPFDLSVGAVDLKTGTLLHPLFHRGFINQDLIFALLRVEPRTPKESFFFRGPGAFAALPSGRMGFQFFGQVHIPYPAGLLFPDPNLATGFSVTADGSLDPYLWIWAFQDSAGHDMVRSGSAERVLSSRGELFSYRYVIPGDPRKHRAEFEYENHSQTGKFRMHSLAWVGFGNSNTGGSDADTLTFSCFGVWSKNGAERVAQAAVQVSASPAAPWIGIQVAQAEISDADTPLAESVFPIPAVGTTLTG